jgi:hypothetical protein
MGQLVARNGQQRERRRKELFTVKYGYHRVRYPWPLVFRQWTKDEAICARRIYKYFEVETLYTPQRKIYKGLKNKIVIFIIDLK